MSGSGLESLSLSPHHSSGSSAVISDLPQHQWSQTRMESAFWTEKSNHTFEQWKEWEVSEPCVRSTINSEFLCFAAQVYPWKQHSVY